MVVKKPIIQHGEIYCPTCHTALANLEFVQLGGYHVKRCWFCGQDINLKNVKGEKENEKAE